MPTGRFDAVIIGGGPATAEARIRDDASNAKALSNAWGF